MKSRRVGISSSPAGGAAQRDGPKITPRVESGIAIDGAESNDDASDGVATSARSGRGVVLPRARRARGGGGRGPHAAPPPPVGYGGRDALGLFGVKRRWRAARLDGAEPAAARACVAHDHDRRGRDAVVAAVPALGGGGRGAACACGHKKTGAAAERRRAGARAGGGGGGRRGTTLVAKGADARTAPRRRAGGAIRTRRHAGHDERSRADVATRALSSRGVRTTPVVPPPSRSFSPSTTLCPLSEHAPRRCSGSAPPRRRSRA